MRSLRMVRQHRQESQADQMRDPLLLRARPLVSQFTAEHARRCQRRREAALGHRIPPGDRHLAKQIAGLPGSAYAIRHIAPRILVTTVRHRLQYPVSTLQIRRYCVSAKMVRVSCRGFGRRAGYGADIIQPAASCSKALTR